MYCGARADPDATEILDPVIGVDVLSPGTVAVDSGRKLSGYFGIPGVRHDLMIDPVKRVVIHHGRRADGRIETRSATEGALDLTPPGVSLPVAELFADLPPPADAAA